MSDPRIATDVAAYIELDDQTIEVARRDTVSVDQAEREPDLYPALWRAVEERLDCQAARPQQRRGRGAA